MDKYNFSTKLAEACATDPLRPVMMCVHFVDGYAYASNGNIAIKQSLEYHSVINPEQLEGKSIHKDSFRQISTFEFATCIDTGVECKDADGRVAFFDYYDRKETAIPDFSGIFDKKAVKSVEFIGFNPEMFSRLAKAMYAPNGNIRVRFQGLDKPILVDAIGIDNQEAVIMPVILQDTIF